MGHPARSLLLALPGFLVSCVALLDFDELQGGARGAGAGGEGAADAGTGGAAAAGGAGGASLTGGAGGASLTGGAGGAAGTGGSAGAGGSDASTGSGGAPADASTDGADAPPPGLPLSGISGALADAACRTLEACAGPALEIVVLADDCRTLFTRVFQDGYAGSIERSIQAGATTYDPVLAATCVETLAGAVSQVPPDCGAFNTVVEDCKSALGGLSAAGGPCSHDFDCGRGLRCDTAATCPGTCAPLRGLGEPCDTTASCDAFANLYCEADPGMPGTCTAYLARGATCTVTGVQCQLGDFCVGQSCRPITDVFTVAEGFSCWGSGSLCRAGLSCEFGGLPFLSAASCVAQRAPLDPCGIALPDSCPAGHYCSANAFNNGGSCLALPIENQPCASSFLQSAGLVSQCAADLTCVGGICKAKKRLDATCEADPQCYSGLCRGVGDAGRGTCSPPYCE